jgi:hypothetical protein
LSAYQLSKTHLRLLVDSMNSFVDGLLLLFEYFRVGSLLETLEDLHDELARERQLILLYRRD